MTQLVLTPVRAGAAAGGGASRLELVRRVDWRFVLDDPLPGRVACLSPYDPSVAEAFELLGVEVDVDPPASRPEAYDLVVLRRRHERDLRRARELVRPGGAVQVELPGRQAGSCVRALADAGFAQPRRFWHWPTWHDCRELVPLDRPEIVRFALGRRRPNGVAAAKRLLGRALLRARLLPYAVAEASVVALKPVPDPTAPPVVTSAAPSYGAWFRGGDALLVTPRFRASRHVLSLVFDAGDDAPTTAVKAARLPSDAAALVEETLNLWALETMAAGAPGTVPRVVASDPGVRPYLVESALAGRPFPAAEVRRDPVAAVGAVCAWLAALTPSAAALPSLDDERFDELVGAPLARLADAYGRGSAEAAMARRTTELLTPLLAARVPLVFEHGDLSPPNVLQLDDGRIGVLDWELAHPEGLPAHDLLFFIAYVAFTLRDARETTAQVAAVHDAFLGASPWAVPALLGYTRQLGIRRTLVPRLFLACWARYAAGLLQRVAVTDDRSLDWLRANRYFALWRHALDHFDDLPGSPRR